MLVELRRGGVALVWCESDDEDSYNRYYDMTPSEALELAQKLTSAAAEASKEQTPEPIRGR